MSQFGMCKFCGAEMVKSPKTGKIFCSDKCWTKNEQKEGGFSGQVAKAGIAADPYQKVMATKNEYIEKAQDRKDESMRILNAKNGAAEITVALIEKGFVQPKDIESCFRKYADYIYAYEPVVNLPAESWPDEPTLTENIPFN